MALSFILRLVSALRNSFLDTRGPNLKTGSSLYLETETELTRTSQRSLERSNNVNQKYGVLKYDFKIEHEPEGGQINIKIVPMHQIKDVVAK